MADEKKRIINLTETDTVTAGDYIAMDSADGGTKKIPASHFTGGSGQVMWGGIQGDITQQADLNGYLTNKANIDGYYDEMSVGSAEQLLSNTYEPDSTPYLYRTSGGSLEIGDRVYEDAIVGGSVAWNQLAPNNLTKTITPSGNTSYEDLTSGITVNTNNIYFVSAKYTYAGSKNLRAYIIVSQTGVPGVYGRPSQDFTTGTTKLEWLIKPQGISTIRFGISDLSLAALSPTDDVTHVTDINIINVTKLFGATIADYLYSLENGQYITIFRSMFPKDYAYNAGSIASVKTSAKRVVGFNAYDNTTGKAHLVGGNEYQITGAYTALAYSTGETITPDANGKFTPSADGELTVTGGNGTTTCVHLVWDGEKDDEYEAYEEHTYPLGNDELRGLFKLSNGKIYADGDVKTSDGQIARRYGILTNQTGAIGDTITLTGAKSDLTDIVTSAGHLANVGTISGTTLTLTKALSGADIVYELATPTTESADPYTNPQLVDNWGTEEFVDTRDVPVPVGHDSRYLPDLKAKLESAPNNPSADGIYNLQYENGEATYVPEVAELPEAPTTDGTYVLKATVSSGTATLSWVAEE